MHKSNEFKIRQNVALSVLDAAGNRVEQWQHNLLGQILFALGRDVKNIFTGKMVGQVNYSNVITNTAKAGLAAMINGSTPIAPFNFIAVGTGTTPESATNSALDAEITDSGLARASASVSRKTSTSPGISNDTAVMTVTYTASASKAVSETAVFNAAAAGDMLNRKTFSAINLSSGNSLQVIHEFTVES